MQSQRFYFYAIPTLVIGLDLISSACGPSGVPSVSVAPTEPVNRGYWVDPQTHLTWAAKDNGYPVSWKQATEFCQHLTTGGFKWKLPMIDQLKSIYYVGENDFGRPVVGNIKLTADYEWSERSGAAVLFLDGEPSPYGSSDHNGRALCVRRAGE